MPTNGIVPSRYVAWVLEHCASRNIPERYLLNHVPLTREQLCDPNGSISWNNLALLFNNLGSYLTDAELVALGKSAWQHAELAELHLTAQLAESAFEQIELVFGVGGLLTLTMPFTTRLTRKNSQHFQLTLNMSPGFSPCRYFQQILAGQLAGLPREPGLTVDVSVRHLPEGAEYHVLLSGGQALANPVWRQFLRLVNPVRQGFRGRGIRQQLIEYQQQLSVMAGRLQRTETRLAQAQGRLRNMGSATGIKLFIVDDGSLVHEASDTKFIGARLQEIFPGLSGVPFAGPQSGFDPHDGSVHVQLCCVPLEQEPGFYLVTAGDDTASATLAEANEMLMSLYSRLSDGVLVTDAGGRVSYANDASLSILGKDPTGTMVTGLIPVDGDDTEAELTRPDGSTRSILVKSTEQLHVLIDRTEHHRLESALQDLEHQLQATQRIQSVGELAGGIAHDFNNLLVVINGYAELGTLAGIDETTMRGYMAEIRRAGDQAVQMTQRLLTFSRGDGAATVTLNLNDLVDNTRRIIERLLPENIEVRFLKGLKDPHVRANAGELEQILVNLAVNARDAMTSGGKLLIAVGQRQQHHGDGRTSELATLTVEDSGSGMSEAVQQEIFKPFYSTKARGQGTGLGLSVVANIVKRLGGSIDLASTPGTGSRFEIRLPLAMPGRPVRSATPKAAREVTGHETLLLAEDNLHVRALAELVLTRAGYRVLLAADGLEAVRLYKQHSREIDLTIVDVVMPRMGGREVTEAIREIRPDALILFTSGYDRHEAETEQFSAHFIAKPYGATSLKSRVREVLDGAT
ncbi:MAG: ATP-binding protein [Pseudomonadota bacterium]